MLRRSAPSILSEDGCFVTLVRSNRFKPDVVGHVGNPWRQLRPHQPRKSVTNTIAAHVADDKARLIVVRERRIDRKSVVKGKSVSVRVDLGGGRINKKKQI